MSSSSAIAAGWVGRGGDFEVAGPVCIGAVQSAPYPAKLHHSVRHYSDLAPMGEEAVLRYQPTSIYIAFRTLRCAALHDGQGYFLIPLIT